MDTADLRFRYTAPRRSLDLLSVGDRDKAHLSWGALPHSRSMPITDHTMAAFLSWVEVIKENGNVTCSWEDSTCRGYRGPSQPTRYLPPRPRDAGEGNNEGPLGPNVPTRTGT